MFEYEVRPSRSPKQFSGRSVRGSVWLAAATFSAILTLGPFAQDAWSGDDKKVQAAAPYKEAAVFIEHNATDYDFGIQFKYDAEGWRVTEIRGPAGGDDKDNQRVILDVKALGKLRVRGLTEGAFESVEPHGAPVDDLKALFPPGTYTFVGETVADVPLKGTATLTYDIPDAPTINEPKKDAKVAVNGGIVIKWDAPNRTPPLAVPVVSQQVVVSREEPSLRIFTVDLGPAASQVTIPPEFLEPDTEYTIEIAFEETSGNRTITEMAFVTTHRGAKPKFTPTVAKITEHDATKIALKVVPGRANAVSVERKRGRKVYVVEVIPTGGGETDVFVDIESGKVVGTD